MPLLGQVNGYTPLVCGMPKLLKTQFAASDYHTQFTRHGVLPVRGFLLDSHGPHACHAISMAQGWFYQLGRKNALVLANLTTPFNHSHSVESKLNNWMTVLTDPYVYSLDIKVKDQRRQRSSQHRHHHNSESEENQQQQQQSRGFPARLGTIGARYRQMPRLPCSDTSNSEIRLSTLPYLSWTMLNSMCKTHVMDQEIFVDTIQTLELYQSISMPSERPETAHAKFCPFVTPLTCLRRFFLLPGSAERVIHLHYHPGDFESPPANKGEHYVYTDGDDHRRQTIFPFPMYDPSKWVIWKSVKTSSLDPSLSQEYAVFRSVLDLILCPPTSTLKYLQGATSAFYTSHTKLGTRPVRLVYDTGNDIWHCADNYVATDAIHEVCLQTLHHVFTVPLPESLYQLMQICPKVDIVDFADPNNNHLILATCLFRLYHLHRIAAVARGKDPCLEELVMQAIDGHVPLMTFVAEHCIFQDDMLLAPWPTSSHLSGRHIFPTGVDRTASHPCAPNSLNEFAGILKQTKSIVDMDKVPRVFYLWPSDSRFRVSLEESPSLSAVINDIGFYVRRREARTATQDWSDPGLALKALLTKILPLRNFKRGSERVLGHCFDAHPSLASLCASLLHMSQIGNLPSATKATFINRMRFWSLHYTTPQVSRRDAWYISNLCFSTWLTYFRVSCHEMFGFYLSNSLPALGTTVFSHPRQGILYFKRLVGVSYIMKSLRRRYSQLPFLVPGLREAVLYASAVLNSYACAPGTIRHLLYTQEILTLRENDMLTKRIGTFIDHATETDALTRNFWTILDQLYTRVLTTLRFLHRARAPWSSVGSNMQADVDEKTPKPTRRDEGDAPTNDSMDDHREQDENDDENEDLVAPERSDDEQEGFDFDDMDLAPMSVEQQEEYTTHLKMMKEAVDAVGGHDLDKGIATELAEVTDKVSDANFAENSTLREAQLQGISSRIDDTGVDDDAEFGDLLRLIDEAARQQTVKQVNGETEDANTELSIQELLDKNCQNMHTLYAQALTRLRKLRVSSQGQTQNQQDAEDKVPELITPDGLRAWSLSDEEFNVVMSQFAGSNCYVPCLDDPGQEDMHDLFRKMCYFVQRYSRPSSQQKLPFFQLCYFGLSEDGLRFLYNQRLYFEACLPTNRLESKTRILWLQQPVDFALIARFLQYIRLYASDQMQLLPREVAQIQVASTIKSNHGNSLCYHIEKERLQMRIDSGKASSYEKQAVERMALGIQSSAFCMSCRNWTEPLAPTISTMYTENRHVETENRKFKRRRVATGVVTEGRAARQTSFSRRTSAPADDEEDEEEEEEQKPDSLAAAKTTQLHPSDAVFRRNVALVKLTHLSNIDIRRTACDFVTNGALVCLSDARSRSVSFSAVITEMAYSRGFSRRLGAGKQLYQGVAAFFSPRRRRFWLDYAKLVNLFPIRPEQLDALMRQVSEIYPELAKRIKQNGFVATSITASCPTEMLDAYSSLKSQKNGAVIKPSIRKTDNKVVAEDTPEYTQENDEDEVQGEEDDEDEDEDDEEEEHDVDDEDEDDDDDDEDTSSTKRKNSLRLNKTSKPKTGISTTMDPEVQNFLPTYHFDKRTRVGTTNGMKHKDVLKGVAQVIKEGIQQVSVFSRHTTHNICGVPADRINMTGRIFFASPHTHSITVHTAYVRCSLCPSIMRAHENTWSDNSGVGYVCAKHSGANRRIDPNNCDLDQIESGGGGVYYPRLLSLNPESSSKGEPAELVMSTNYTISQASQLNGLPPQWITAHRKAGFDEFENFWRYYMTCDKCESPANVYAHTHAALNIHRTSGIATVSHMCEQCTRKHYTVFATRFRASDGRRKRPAFGDLEGQEEDEEEQDEEGGAGTEGDPSKTSADTFEMYETYTDDYENEYGDDYE